MNNIKIINDQMDLKKEEKSDLYINIFGEEPWNEWYKCNDCDKLFWLSEIDGIKKCTCGWLLELFYDKDEVENNRNDWTKKEGYVWKLAENPEWEMIWFIMWRESNIDKLNKEKLWLDENQIKILLNSIKEKFDEFDSEKIFYAADMWVKKDWRWVGIASSLYKAREKSIVANGMKFVIVRTTKKSDKPYKWYKNEWFVDVFDYQDQQERVLLVKKIQF